MKRQKIQNETEMAINSAQIPNSVTQIQQLEKVDEDKTLQMLLVSEIRCKLLLEKSDDEIKSIITV